MAPESGNIGSSAVSPTPTDMSLDTPLPDPGTAAFEMHVYEAIFSSISYFNNKEYEVLSNRVRAILPIYDWSIQDRPSNTVGRSTRHRSRALNTTGALQPMEPTNYYCHILTPDVQVRLALYWKLYIAHIGMNVEFSYRKQ